MVKYLCLLGHIDGMLLAMHDTAASVPLSTNIPFPPTDNI